MLRDYILREGLLWELSRQDIWLEFLSKQITWAFIYKELEKFPKKEVGFADFNTELDAHLDESLKMFFYRFDLGLQLRSGEDHGGILDRVDASFPCLGGLTFPFPFRDDICDVIMNQLFHLTSNSFPSDCVVID